MTLEAADPGRREPGAGPALLEVEGLHFAYGLSPILSDVQLEVFAGERVALLGTNGAGKSTLLRVISGLAVPSAGRVTFDGRVITHADPRTRINLGMVQLPGGRGGLPSLTVRENLHLAAYNFARNRALVDERSNEVLAHFPHLRSKLGQKAGELSGGEQQMLLLARGLMVRPRLLLIDELSLGLAPVVVGQLIDILDELTEQGVAMVIVEQSINVALRLARRAYFLERGAVRFSGALDDLANRDDLVRATFLGAAAKGLRS